jgi:3-oxoacyl-[acyl-carrier protein] reductase
MDLGIHSRSAMVAASSKGIGKAIARALLKEGVRVSIAARGTEALEAARVELSREASPDRVLAVPCDVTDPGSLQAWFDLHVTAFGGVDILVTNTGGPPAARFLELTEAQWKDGIDGTLLSAVRLSKLAAVDMQKRRWGRIVHITSFVAKQPMPLLTVSSTLRAGLSALTKTMSTQLAPDGILVNAVLPGHVMTDRQVHLNTIRSREEGVSVEEYTARSARAIPLGRAAGAEEIGDVVAFLASERASYLTGVTLQVDGGLVQSTF